MPAQKSGPGMSKGSVPSGMFNIARSTGSTPRQGSSSIDPSERAGIGIILALSPDNSLYVHTVCPGSSAEGHLLPGDVLVKIDNDEVFQAPAPMVADMLLGAQGSSVEVWVRRPKNPNARDLEFTTHVVKVTRRRTDPSVGRNR